MDRRTVTLEFQDQAHFARDYKHNISKGGVFVRTDEIFKVREPVDIEIILGFKGETVVISGEVVGVISKEMSSAGEAGVAVQIHEDATELELRFGDHLEVAGSGEISLDEPVPERNALKPKADLPVEADKQAAVAASVLGAPKRKKSVAKAASKSVKDSPVEDQASMEDFSFAADGAASGDDAEEAAEPSSIQDAINDSYDLPDELSDIFDSGGSEEEAEELPELELVESVSSATEENEVSDETESETGDEAEPEAGDGDFEIALDDAAAESVVEEISFGSDSSPDAAVESNFDDAEDFGFDEVSEMAPSDPAQEEPGEDEAEEEEEPEEDEVAVDEEQEESDEEDASSERRRADRSPAHVSGQISSSTGTHNVHSQNISQSGVLISVEGESVPVGDTVKLILNHPVTGDELSVEGSVARHQETDGSVSALAIRFEISEERRTEISEFIDDVKAAEHAKSLAGIHGLIAEMGAPKVVQMFSTAAPEGTLFFKRNEEEGTIVFSGGMFRWASVGEVSGRKALWRMMSWESGIFEFRSHAAESEEADEVICTMQDVVLQGVQNITEMKHLDLDAFPTASKLSLKKKFPKNLTGIESAVVDLARSSLTVRRVLDVIPDADVTIYRALVSLKERGVIRISS